MKEERLWWMNLHQSNNLVNQTQLPLLYEKSGADTLAAFLVLVAAGNEILVNLKI